MILFIIFLIFLLLCIVLLYEYEPIKEEFSFFRIFRRVKQQNERQRLKQDQDKLQKDMRDTIAREQNNRQLINSDFDTQWLEYVKLTTILNELIKGESYTISNLDLSPYSNDTKPEPTAAETEKKDLNADLGTGEIVRPTLDATSFQYILELTRRSDDGRTIKFDNKRMKTTGNKANDKDHHERVRIYWMVGKDFVLLEKWNGSGDKFVHKRGTEVYWSGPKNHEGKNHGNNKFDGSRGNHNQYFRLLNVNRNDPTVFKIKHNDGAFVGHTTTRQEYIGRDTDLKLVDEARAYHFKMCTFNGDCSKIDFMKRQEPSEEDIKASAITENDYSKAQLTQITNNNSQIYETIVKCFGFHSSQTLSPIEKAIQKYICIYHLRDLFVGENGQQYKLRIELFIRKYEPFVIPERRPVPYTNEIISYKKDIAEVFLNHIKQHISACPTMLNALNILNEFENTIVDLQNRINTIASSSEGQMNTASTLVNACSQINSDCIVTLQSLEDKDTLMRHHDSVYSSFMEIQYINALYEAVINFMINTKLLKSDSIFYYKYIETFNDHVIMEYLEIDTSKTLGCEQIDLLLYEMQLINYGYRVYIKQSEQFNEKKMRTLISQHEANI
jgi:hypothetical protein